MHFNFRIKQILISFLLLLSGFAGISYEVLYGRMLGNLVGDQFIVSASVLITFLLGTGIGALWAHRIFNKLWLIELGIGLFGILFSIGFESLKDFLYLKNIFASSIFGKILFCSILLLIPSFLIGCSVPLFSEYLKKEGNSFGFSKVYSIYNFGAAFTAFGLEFLLIRIIGIVSSLLVFSFLNILIALSLRLLFRESNSIYPQSEENKFPKRVLFSLFLASIASAIFQLYMLKLTEMFFGPFRENFALVLTIVLLGIAVGSILVRIFKLSFPTLMIFNLIFLFLIFIDLEFILKVYASFYKEASKNHGVLILFKFTILLVFMGIPAIGFGSTIPSLLLKEEKIAKDSGYLLFLSAIANSIGFLFMVFVIYPNLDFGIQLFVTFGITICAWIFYEKNIVDRILYSIIAMSLVWLSYANLWKESIFYISYTSFHSVEELETNLKTIKQMESFKGNQDTFSINSIDGTTYFFINGYISFPLNSSSEKIVGLISSLFSPRTDDALVLGLGSGSTASAVALSFENTDTVEINPLVRENLFRLKEWNFDLANNPNVKFFVDDAMHFTRTATKKYSLILNTVTSPLYFSSSKLYTVDFFKYVKKSLKPDGIYATWVDSRMGDRGFNIIMKSLQQEFKECGLLYIKNSYFLLLCGEQKIFLHQKHLLTTVPLLREELLVKYGILPEYIPYHILTTDAFSLIGDTNVLVNSLDFPSLENEMASLEETGVPLLRKRIKTKMNAKEIQYAIGESDEDWNPTKLLVEAEAYLKATYITERWKEIFNDQKNFSTLYKNAKYDYFSTLADNAKTARSYHKYGHFLLNNEMYKEAIVQFEKTLKNNPKYNNTNYNLGLCYYEMKEYKKAAKYFEKELEVDPRDEEAVKYLIKILKKFI